VYNNPISPINGTKYINWSNFILCLVRFCGGKDRG
jgi:hypothetical protein